MFKFIHAADIHLDSPLRGLERYEGAPVSEIRGATRKALENLATLAIDERVAFVLIAGDLYDGDWPDYSTGLYLNAQMARLRDAGIAVVVIQGNHDAANLMTKNLRLPDNVRMLSTRKPESFVIERFGTVVHGQGFATRSVKENIAKAYPTAAAGLFNVGLLHTCATGRDGHESYAPCSLDDLRSREYDYWALGHVHQFECLHADPPIVFAGNVQGRHARETGSKGCILVTVDDSNRARMERRELDVLRWTSCRVDATDVPDDDALLERVDRNLRSLVETSDDRFLAVRMEITGVCAIHDALSAGAEGWIAQIRARARDVGSGRLWLEKVKVRTSSTVVPDLSDGPLGEFVRYLEELGADDQALSRLGAELSDLKRKLPSELKDGEEALDIDSPARLREVLEQLRPMVIQGILASGMLS